MRLRSLLLIPVIGASLMLAGCENPFAPTGGGSTAPEVAPEAKAAIEQKVQKELESQFIRVGGRWDAQKFQVEMATINGSKSVTSDVDDMSDVLLTFGT